MAPLTSLRHFVQQQPWTGVRTGLDTLILDLADTCLLVRQDICEQALDAQAQQTEHTNPYGDLQKRLDLDANAYFLRCAEEHPRVSYYASEEMPHVMRTGHNEDGFALVVDPLDGSSNIEVNVSIGSIISILPTIPDHSPESVCCQAGQHLCCALYCLYGPATQLVFSVGSGTHIFTLDIQTGQFYLSHSHVRIPAQTREFAINAANQRHWYPAVQHYIRDCLLGQTGPRQRDFNMRWVASLVADAHRILRRGGIFLYPADQRPNLQHGRLRLLYEAAPMAYLITQAGGCAITDHGQEILSCCPQTVHDTIPLILGSAQEIDTYLHYHQEYTS